ncbi:hypothetical protein CAPTEDRAFT_214011 [Capitella teleta]|uniref:Methyltransferase domain-containing protein n=1 Tax=Capitella teleta TaxID=283909 RepID=R7TQ26_CAPTE|nr:hypothetical protein CAPTEDRAFT_214011 [Capitella teleta]|eukprot:ELT93140.1 hypothetical protein CAPTEDRAFT_214011 [Capitella teleta]
MTPQLHAAEANVTVELRKMRKEIHNDRSSIIVFDDFICRLVEDDRYAQLSSEDEFNSNAVDTEAKTKDTSGKKPDYPYIKLLNRKNITVSRDMSSEEAAVNFYEYMEDLSASCLIAKRFGVMADGGWYTCLAGPYALKPGCLVYSIGIADDWTFDDQISSEMGCTVRSFDPSVKVDGLQHGPNVHMYELGLGDVDGVNDRGWKMHSLPSLMEAMGDGDKVLDFFKIDIEWSEYKTFTAMFKTDIMSRIKQIGLELHFKNFFNDNYFLAWRLVSDIEKHGFRVWAVDHNYDNTYNDTANKQIKGLFCCSNVYFINIRYMDEFIENYKAVSPNVGVAEGNIAELVSAEEQFTKFMEIQRPELCDQSLLQGHHVHWDVCLSKGNLKVEANSCDGCEFHTENSNSMLAHNMKTSLRKRLNCTLRRKIFEDPSQLVLEGCIKQAKPSGVDVVLLELGWHLWSILDTILKDEGFAKIKQIVLVAHLDQLMDKVNTKTRSFAEVREAIEKLETKGFLRWKTLPYLHNITARVVPKKSVQDVIETLSVVPGVSEVGALWIVENETWSVVKRGVEMFMENKPSMGTDTSHEADKGMVWCDPDGKTQFCLYILFSC